MKKLLLGLFIFGLTSQINAQTVELPETIISVNYKYLNAVDMDNAPNNVKKLEREAIHYKITNSDQVYNDEYDMYTVSFRIPEGKIVAAYDHNGKIIKTIERYKNVRLPMEVMQAIAKRFPNWGIVEDIYLIKYKHDEKTLDQEYKVKIKNDDKILMVRTNEMGEFI